MKKKSQLEEYELFGWFSLKLKLFYALFPFNPDM